MEARDPCSGYYAIMPPSSAPSLPRRAEDKHIRQCRIRSGCRCERLFHPSRGMGQLNTAALRPIFVTKTGVTVARIIGARVCSGDSGGPVIENSKDGARLSGVASAIINVDITANRA